MLIMITEQQLIIMRTIPSDLKKYRNLKTDIEDLSKAKDN